MKNVIIPFSLGSLQQRDHIVYDKVGGEDVILKRGTYEAASYNTARYTLPKSQVVGIVDGVVNSAPIDVLTTKMFAANDCYRITGLAFPIASISTIVYAYNIAGVEKTFTNVTDIADFVSKFNAAYNSSYAKAVALTDGQGVGITIGAYEQGDMSNAVWSNMRFRISALGSLEAVKESKQAVLLGNTRVYHTSPWVYQCESIATILKAQGIAFLPAGVYPQMNNGRIDGNTFHLDKAVDYYSTNGSAAFSATSRMNLEAFNACASSSVAAERNMWDRFGGSYPAYIASFLMRENSVKGVNAALWQAHKKMTNILGNIITYDVNLAETPAYPSAASVLAFGQADHPLMAAGKWHAADWQEMQALMKLTGKAATHKTAWDNEIIRCGGTPYYATHTTWLSCCEYASRAGFFFYGTHGTYANSAEFGSYYGLAWSAFKK